MTRSARAETAESPGGAATCVSFPWWPSPTLAPLGLGLRGTGSGDFEISDIFVPQDQVNAEIFGTAIYDRALFRIKEMPEVGHGAHALGIASAALESFVDAVNTKPLPGSTRHMAMGHMQAHQIAFARADVLIRAARALLYETVRAAYADARANPELPLELKILYLPGDTIFRGNSPPRAGEPPPARYRVFIPNGDVAPLSRHRDRGLSDMFLFSVVLAAENRNISVGHLDASPGWE